MSDSTTAQAPKFGKIREILWPIHSYELKKFTPMFLMFFFISFVYSLLRITKDTLVVNAPGLTPDAAGNPVLDELGKKVLAGGDVLPALKFCTFAAAIFFISMYIKASSKVKKENLFYVAMAPFAIFFVLFYTVLYPYANAIHPHASADWLQSTLPQGFKGIVSVYRNWSFSLFYVFSELWGSIALSVLCWGFANETTRLSEAKRFYALFLIGANVALLTLANVMSYAMEGGFDAGVSFICKLTLAAITAVIACYYYMNTVVLVDPRFANTQPMKKKKKEKLGLWDSMKELYNNKYLAYIAILVLAYGITINLVEVTWKDSLKVFFDGDKAAYAKFQSQFMVGTGAMTILFLYAGTNNILRVLGWKVTALITPIVLLITSVIFFANLTFSQFLQGMYASLAMSPIVLVAWIGGLQNILTKSAKYAFFDTTKEMAYIPLDAETKRKGKAAIDGVGGRLGKLGGAGINLILILIMGSLQAITPIVAVLTVIIGFFWLASVKKLGTEFEARTSKKED